VAGEPCGPFASRYEAVKHANAFRLPADRLGYTDAKADVVAGLLAVARDEAGIRRLG